MLLSHWIKCTQGDIRYVRKKVRPDSDEEPTEGDKDRWFDIYDVYIERFGLGKLYNRILKAQLKLAKLELKYVKTRDRFLLTLIGIEEEKIRALMEDNGEGMSVEQSLVYLSKWYGSPLRPREITVMEYKTILIEYGKVSKKERSI